MKRVIVLIAFAIIVARDSFAQDIDREKFVVNYIELPSKKLPDDIETYRMTIVPLQTAWGNVLGSPENPHKLGLRGYYLLDSVDADLNIQVSPVREMEVTQVKLEIKKCFIILSAGNGSTPSEYFAYQYNVSYRTPQVAVKLIKKDGTIIEERMVDGDRNTATFGVTGYDNAFKSEAELARAWELQNKLFLKAVEKKSYDGCLTQIAVNLRNYCLQSRTIDFLSIHYVNDKKKNNYADLKEAKDLFIEGIAYLGSDKVTLINKLLQPDYEKRTDIIKKAIAIWEKALSESDVKNRKARIDAKVTRHINYNLAVAYLWINEFAAARKCLEASKEKISLLSGVRDLSWLLEEQERRYQANNWRKLITTDDQPYVYRRKVEKAPATIPTAAKKTPAARAEARKKPTSASANTSGNTPKASPKKTS